MCFSSSDIYKPQFFFRYLQASIQYILHHRSFHMHWQIPGTARVYQLAVSFTFLPNKSFMPSLKRSVWPGWFHSSSSEGIEIQDSYSSCFVACFAVSVMMEMRDDGWSSGIMIWTLRNKSNRLHFTIAFRWKMLFIFKQSVSIIYSKYGSDGKAFCCGDQLS